MFARAALVLVVAVHSLAAAKWDGPRGPFTIHSYEVPEAFVGIKGLIVIAVRCSDPSITNASIEIQHADALGQVVTLRLSTELTHGNGGVLVGLSEHLVVSVKVIARRDAGEY